MTRLTLCALVVFGALTACGGPRPEPAAAPPANDAQRAAQIELAVRATPDRADSVLAAHSVSADELLALMYRVAADSALSAEYRRLTER